MERLPHASNCEPVLIQASGLSFCLNLLPILVVLQADFMIEVCKLLGLLLKVCFHDIADLDETDKFSPVFDH